MKRKIIPVLIGCVLSFSALTAQPTAEHYVVSFPEGTHMNYADAFTSASPSDLPIEIGSGLLSIGKQSDALTLVAITGRGPNADSPKEGEDEAKIFVTLDFAPLLMTIRVQNSKAKAIDPHPLYDDKGAINGLSLTSDVIGSASEAAFSDTLYRLRGDNRGLGMEEITPDGKGGYWLCGEYGPFLINIDSKGRTRAIHGPQVAEGEKTIAGSLPNILKWRQANCGLEGLTRMPDGHIIVTVQSALDIDAKNEKKTLFTHLVSFDLANRKTAMCGYPIGSAACSKNNDAEIGDIVAFDDQHILLIEQRGGRNNRMCNLIYEIDLNKAGNLSGFDELGEYPRFDGEKTLSQRDITLTQKTQVADLHSLGWQQEKAEGLALINSKMLAVTSDDDFGVKMTMRHPVENRAFKDCRVNVEGKLALDDK